MFYFTFLGNTKCLFEKLTLLHCLWKCLQIQMFWKDVIRCLTELFKVKVPLEVKLCIIGIIPNRMGICYGYKYMLQC